MKAQYIKFLLAALMLIAIVSCSGDTTEENVEVEKVISVKAQLLSRSSIDIKSVYTGSLEGQRQAVIYAKIAEAVNNISVVEGQIVKANQVIIELDKTGPSSNLSQAYSLYQNSEKTFKKMEHLYSEGAISETDFDAAKTDFEVKLSAYEGASKLVNIETPIDGMVTALHVSSGEFVQVGQKLATIATADKLRVKFGVNPDKINIFSQGAEVIVTSEALGQQKRGKVVAVASSADLKTREFEVEAIFDNHDNLFKPGMFVNISFIESKMNDVILIPRKAILNLNNKDVVYVIKDSQAKLVEIQTGTDVDGLIVVTNGLDAGDTLVTIGQSYLEDGVKVNVTALDESN